MIRSPDSSILIDTFYRSTTVNLEALPQAVKNILALEKAFPDREFACESRLCTKYVI